MEHYLAYILKWLAKISGQEYNGEFRNGHCAHFFAGWALTLSTVLFNRCFIEIYIPRLLATVISLLPLIYGIYREFEDAKYSLSNWNNKSWADLLTWTIGCIIGLIIGEGIWLSYYIF